MRVAAKTVATPAKGPPYPTHAEAACYAGIAAGRPVSMQCEAKALTCRLQAQEAVVAEAMAAVGEAGWAAADRHSRARQKCIP